jgi:hypothetical protein
MNHIRNCLIIAILLITIIDNASSQKRAAGADAITSGDLESYVTFLASPLLRGRVNGGPELEIAQEFIATNARLLGLKPANGTSFFQPYTVLRQSVDPAKTRIQVIPEGQDTITIKDPVVQLFPRSPSDFKLDGEVVFAGYGIKDEKQGYDDFEFITTEGKILLVMTGSPAAEEGKISLPEEADPAGFKSMMERIRTLMFSKARAVLIVMGPRSGYSTIEEAYPGITDELNSTKTLKGDKPLTYNFPGSVKILFVSTVVADELFKGSGTSLAELQKKIDTTRKPQSFSVTGKRIMITEAVRSDELTLKNVVAYVEGSDPVLRDEFIIFSSHADHIGTSGGKVNPGADDDASGCAALLSIAEAFQSLENKPKRSILFLWVSGEEIGLFGSKSYVRDPVVPLEKTIVDLNMDMIGRVKGVADSTSETPMTGPGEVFVITGKQSRELLSIAEDVDGDINLNFDYSLSGRDHPLQLFARSDHYNFVLNDIPVLFFTTGLHSDYHSPEDVAERLDFNKMEQITKAMFSIGYIVADKKVRLKVNNPYSKWQKN